MKGKHFLSSTVIVFNLLALILTLVFFPSVEFKQYRQVWGLVQSAIFIFVIFVNLWLRLVTHLPIGKEGKKWFRSRTILTNIGIAFFSVAIAYVSYRYHVSVRIALWILFVAIVNIVLRVKNTKKSVRRSVV